MSDDLRRRYVDLVIAWFEPGERLARLDELLALRDEDLRASRDCAEKAEAARTAARERLDALIAAGFGATTDTLRALRAALDAPEPDHG